MWVDSSLCFKIYFFHYNSLYIVSHPVFPYFWTLKNPNTKDMTFPLIHAHGGTGHRGYEGNLCMREICVIAGCSEMLTIN